MKKVVEIKGTKKQKTMLVFQVIALLAILGIDIYMNVANITSGTITKIPTYLLYIVLVLNIIINVRD